MNPLDSRQFYLPFFQELLTCGQELYSWTYDAEFRLLSDNCPNSRQYHILFPIQEYRERLLKLCRAGALPVIVTDSLGLMWVVDFETDGAGELRQIHMIGPAIMDAVSASKLNEALSRMQLSSNTQSQVTGVLSALPILPITRMCQYGLMLHFTLTGERITIGDIRFLGEAQASVPSVEMPQRRQQGAWAYEQEILRHVSEGSTDVRRRRDQFSLSMHVGKLSDGDPICQMKNQTIIFTALCMRAAIRGSLSPDTAYELSDRYILTIENCTQISDIIEVGKTMEDDFTRRVKKAKESNGVSPQIQRCCDYILMNLHKKISVQELADMAGFAKNYFMVKFREETGKTIADYIWTEKMERAKELLKATNKSVLDISEFLGYATQSHFGKRFQEYTGYSPKAYREMTGPESPNS